LELEFLEKIYPGRPNFSVSERLPICVFTL
jgi:hypothetical protein